MFRAKSLAAVAACALLAPLVASAAVASAPAAQPAQQPPVAGKTQPVAAPAAAPQKASPAERAAANRMDPLARAAFWGREAQIDPTDATAGVQLASALRVMGQYDAAVQAVGRVLIVSPNSLDGLMEIARDYVAKGDGFYAIDPLQRAQALAPRDWRPVSLLGVAYAQVKRSDDAQGAWRQALALSPDNPAVLANMAMELAANGDAAGAETLLRRAVVQPGATLTVRQDLSLVLGLEGKLTEAEAELRRDLPPTMADADLAYLQAASSGHAGATADTSTRTWAALKSGS